MTDVMIFKTSNSRHIGSYKSFQHAIEILGVKKDPVNLLIDTIQVMKSNLVLSPNITLLFISEGAIDGNGYILYLDSPNQIVKPEDKEVFIGNIGVIYNERED